MRAGWLLALALVCLPLAAAHAEPQQSDPAPSSRLDAMPSQVWVRFTEPVHREGSWIRVLDGEGQRVDGDDLRIEGTGTPTMTISLQPDLPDGAYRIIWQTYSQSDGHTITGTIGFAVGGFAPPSSGVDEKGDLAITGALARMVMYAGFALALGGLAFTAWVQGDLRVTRAAVLGAALHLAGVTGLFLETWSGTGLAMQAFAAAGGGAELVFRVVLALALLIASAAVHRRPGRGPAIIIAILWAWASIASASLGHITDKGAYGIAFETIHLVAASVWVGGLFALFSGLWHADRRLAHAWGKRFGTLAIICVALLAGTGFVMAAILMIDAWRLDPSIVTQDTWTWFLSAKLVGVAGMLGAALINRQGYLGGDGGFARALRRFARLDGSHQGFRRVVAWEVGFAVVTLAAAGLLLSVGAPQALAEGEPVLERAGQGNELIGLMQIMPLPAAGQDHLIRVYIQDGGQAPERNNTCGRDDCMRLSWQAGDDAASRQETTLVPEGDGWWRAEDVLLTTRGATTFTVEAQTRTVYLDTIQFPAVEVA